MGGDGWVEMMRMAESEDLSLLSNFSLFLF